MSIADASRPAAVPTIIKLAACNLMLACLSVVVIELFFGAWVGARFDPRLRVRQDVEYSLDTSSLYPSIKPTQYRRDHWGLRGAIPSPGKVDVVTIGGSTTDQLYISEGDTWQDRFAAALDPSLRPIVANAGLDGQSTVGHIAAIQGWLTQIPGLHPKLVLIYAGINDLFVETRIDRDGIAAKEPLHHLQQILEQRSAIVAAIQCIVGAIEARRGYLTHAAIALDESHAQWAPIRDQIALRAATSQRRSAYADRLATLARLVRAWGAEPVFITQPHAFRRLTPTGDLLGLVMSNGEMDPFMLNLGLFNEETLATCYRLEATCIDLAGELSLGPADFYDTIHYTPAGATKIGQYLAAKLYPVLVRTNRITEWKRSSYANR
jgi:lysophospholipase L1-like esterase